MMLSKPKMRVMSQNRFSITKVLISEVSYSASSDDVRCRHPKWSHPSLPWLASPVIPCHWSVWGQASNPLILACVHICSSAQPQYGIYFQSFFWYGSVTAASLHLTSFISVCFSVLFLFSHLFFILFYVGGHLKKGHYSEISTKQHQHAFKNVMIMKSNNKNNL